MTHRAMFANSQPKTKNARNVTARVASVKLSDGSYAYNVLVIVDGATVTFAAEDVHHASRLQTEINGCAWIEHA